MARGTTDEDDLEKDEQDDAGESAGKPDRAEKADGKKGATGAQTRFEEAWHGWLKPVGGIVAVILAYMLYEYQLLPESFSGRALVAAVLGGSVWLALDPVFSRFEVKRDKILLGVFAAVWVIAAAGPLFRRVYWLPTELATTVLTASEKGTTAADLKLPDGANGPYEITVAGTLRGSGEADANYKLTFHGDGDTVTDIDDALRRTVARQPSGGGAVRIENTTKIHRLGSVRGNKLTVDAEVAGEMLVNGLRVSVHNAGLHPLLFVALGFLIFLVGAGLDYRLVAPKVEGTYIATIAAFTLAFSVYCGGLLERLSADFPGVTPTSLVRPAVSGLVFALLFGALPGWLVSRIVNSYKPRPKKMAGKAA